VFRKVRFVDFLLDERFDDEVFEHLFRVWRFVDESVGAQATKDELAILTSDALLEGGFKVLLQFGGDQRYSLEQNEW